jgi:hypothetical protein
MARVFTFPTFSMKTYQQMALACIFFASILPSQQIALNVDFNFLCLHLPLNTVPINF